MQPRARVQDAPIALAKRSVDSSDHCSSSPGNKAAVEGISRARFIDVVYLVSASADDLIAATGQHSAPSHCDYDYTLWIQSGQDFGLVGRVIPPGQKSRLVVVGEKGVCVRQHRRDLVQRSRGSGPNHDIQHRLEAPWLHETAGQGAEGRSPA